MKFLGKFYYNPMNSDPALSTSDENRIHLYIFAIHHLDSILCLVSILQAN